MKVKDLINVMDDCYITIFDRNTGDCYGEVPAELMGLDENEDISIIPSLDIFEDDEVDFATINSSMCLCIFIAK